MRLISGWKVRLRRGEGIRMSIVVELWRFMRVRKRYWLLPVLIMMCVFGGLVVLTQGSAVAPFIYTLF
jgi:uncharacterized protein DUF5989